MFHVKAKRLREILFATGILLLADAAAAPGTSIYEVKFATFNASLNRNISGELISDLSSSDDPQAQAVAEIIQRTRPDVLLVNEFDFDQQNEHGTSLAARLFQENYLSRSQNEAEPIVYPHRVAFPSNTGIHSSSIVHGGVDLDNNGIIDPRPDQTEFPGFVNYGNDSLGFGAFPGQYAFVVYSMYPIAFDEIRTFQHFLWRDMPDALLPSDPATGTPWYSPEELDIVRLSSKNHADVPIVIGTQVVHFLVSHPTPPVFDGPEDRNGTRNHDEIRFWADYIGPGNKAGYIYDDQGRHGGLKPGELFVIAGDQNADPFDGDSVPGAAQQLLAHELVNTKVTPDSQGGIDRALAQNEINDTHTGDPAFDTADFAEAQFGGPGNLRVDYVLPRKNLMITDAGVFWPADDDPLSRLTGTGFPVVSSDHRLVYVTVRVPMAAR